MIGEEWLTRPLTGKLLLLGTPPILVYKKMAIKRQKQTVVSKSLVAIAPSEIQPLIADEGANKQTATL